MKIFHEAPEFLSLSLRWCVKVVKDLLNGFFEMILLRCVYCLIFVVVYKC